MNEAIVKLLVIYVIFIVIYIIMEFKSGTFISEKYTMTWFYLAMLASQIIIVSKSDYYYSYIPSLFIIVIMGVYLVFQKNRIYVFNGIDKKSIRENKDEIIKIIDNYKNNHIDYKSEITFLKNKIVFEGVNKPHVGECLLLIESFLNESRKSYTLMDYVIYIVKAWILPFAIGILAAFIAIKLTV